MEELSVTWLNALKIWWSWAWRATLPVLVTSFLMGFIAAAVMSKQGLNVENYIGYVQLLGMAVGVFFSVFAMKRILGKQFNGYRIALVKTSHTD